MFAASNAVVAGGMNLKWGRSGRPQPASQARAYRDVLLELSASPSADAFAQASVRVQ